LYLLSQYGDHPAFYRFNGKGFFYVYDSYQISADEWRQQLISSSIDGRQHIYFVGLILKSIDCQQLINSGFDAAYSYFAANGFTDASTSQRWPTIMQECQPLPFLPSIGPGYIDTNVRPWNGKTIRLRDNGNYYRQMFNDLSRLINRTIVTITSFNEWGEGTQIEPATDSTVSTMITYERYHLGPFTYIDLTRELLFSQ
jgi:hypothetical protein